MIRLKGDFNTADVFIDHIDQTTMDQIKNFLNNEAFSENHIAIMPDCHAGVGAVIGFTMKLGSYIIPNIIGVDIGCGVCIYELENIKHIDFESLDKFIRNNIPYGFDIRKKPVIDKYNPDTFDANYERELTKTSSKIGMDRDKVLNSLGTLGGGNHFIEIGKDDDGTFYLIIHTGSRHFGLKVANFHQKKAKEYCKKNNIKTSSSLEYLRRDSEEGMEYLNDMKIAQNYAKINRFIISKILIKDFFGLSYNKIKKIESVHNYINFNDNIIRKGAISAHKDEDVVIPLNMRDGVIIGKGKGLKNWNYSAPHGAGRVMSRSQAKNTLSISDFKKVMENVWSSCINRDTIDEAPMVYKNSDEIIEKISEVVEIEKRIYSVYNFKGGGED